MDRRGSLEWSLETTGKLVLYVAILLLIVWMSYKLISLFINGNEEYTAKRTLQIINDRIEMAQKLEEREATVILHPPAGFAFYSFSRGTEAIYSKRTLSTAGSTTTESVRIDRPGRFSGCDSNSCLCVYSLDFDATAGGAITGPGKLVECRSFKVARMEGGIEIPKGVSDNEPQVVRIELQGDKILVQPQKYGLGESSDVKPGAEGEKPSEPETHTYAVPGS